jgi:hypothetical protein
MSCVDCNDCGSKRIAVPEHGCINPSAPIESTDLHAQDCCGYDASCQKHGRSNNPGIVVYPALTIILEPKER